MKFKTGDKAYSIRVSNNLTVMVQEGMVYSVENRKDYDWYSVIGLGHEVISDHEIDNSEILERIKDEYFDDMDKNTLKPYVTSGTKGEYLYHKDDLDKAIIESVERKKNALKTIAEKADKFRCPITGGRMFRVINRLHILDGPTEYRVEGHNIVWEVWPRDYEPRPYHTTYGGRKYSFERLPDDTWRELFMINGDNGGGMYVDKALYEAGDEETINKAKEFLEREREKKKERGVRNKEGMFTSVALPTAKKIAFSTVAAESVEVKPMSKPSGFCPYFEVGEKFRLEIDGFEVEVDEYVFKALKMGSTGGVIEFGDSKIRIL